MSFYSEKMYIPKDENKEKNVYYQRFFSDVNGKILDVGCSTGNFVALDPKNIVGIDIDKDAIKIAKQRGLNCILMDIDGKKLNFKDNFFAGINAHHIIEHLENPLKTVKEF
jgi:2-polyprenyl-3-methyl-5-hydroxy-6-metoxy-1,4-benzoquinol methylase